MSKDQLDALEFGARAVVGGEKPAPLNAGERVVRKGLFDLVSHLTPMPTISASAEAWSFKNTMLAVHAYLLACTAHGLATAPMEGFDGRRVREVLEVPDTYAIPVVVSTGYPDLEAGKGKEYPPSARLPFEEMFSEDTFDYPMYDDVAEGE